MSHYENNKKSDCCPRGGGKFRNIPLLPVTPILGERIAVPETSMMVKKEKKGYSAQMIG